MDVFPAVLNTVVLLVCAWGLRSAWRLRYDPLVLREPDPVVLAEAGPVAPPAEAPAIKKPRYQPTSIAVASTKGDENRGFKSRSLTIPARRTEPA
ncbi:MAG TPA: hypothetical protein VGB53_02680 [Rubricoccaceae bacterium]|jgi:hypothetical protein